MKYLFLDVDGTLTDGKIYMGANGEMMKAFSIKDGYALGTLCRNFGIEPVIITGRKSEIVKRRCSELGITELFQGYQDKMPVLLRVIGDTPLTECAYAGDDILDLPCIDYIRNGGGMTGCPADAAEEVIQAVQFVCGKNGGDGAVREFVEWLINV